MLGGHFIARMQHDATSGTWLLMPGSGKCLMEYSMRLFALEAAKLNVNCNVIIPGVTRSDAWGKLAEHRGLEKDDVLNMVAKRVPMKQKVVDPLDIGNVVVF